MGEAPKALKSMVKPLWLFVQLLSLRRNVCPATTGREEQKLGPNAVVETAVEEGHIPVWYWHVAHGANKITSLMLHRTHGRLFAFICGQAFATRVAWSGPKEVMSINIQS